MRSLKIILTLLLSLFASDAFAAQSAYVPNVRFVPLPPPNTRAQMRNQIITPPARFMPLTQTRYPAPIRLDRNVETTAAAQDYIIPPTPVNANSINKPAMSSQQAQQLLSIFGENK